MRALFGGASGPPPVPKDPGGPSMTGLMASDEKGPSEPELRGTLLFPAEAHPMPAAERCWLNAAHCHPWYADCRGGCPRWSLPPWMDRESRRAHSRLRSEAVPARDRSRHIECGTASSLRWARYTVDTNQGR